MTPTGTRTGFGTGRRGSSRRGGCACRLLGVRRRRLLLRVDGVEGCASSFTLGARAAPALTNCLFLSSFAVRSYAPFHHALRTSRGGSLLARALKRSLQERAWLALSKASALSRLISIDRVLVDSPHISTLIKAQIPPRKC